MNKRLRTKTMGGRKIDKSLILKRVIRKLLLERIYKGLALSATGRVWFIEGLKERRTRGKLL